MTLDFLLLIANPKRQGRISGSGISTRTCFEASRQAPISGSLRCCWPGLDTSPYMCTWADRLKTCYGAPCENRLAAPCDIVKPYEDLRKAIIGAEASEIPRPRWLLGGQGHGWLGEPGIPPAARRWPSSRTRSQRDGHGGALGPGL